MIKKGADARKKVPQLPSGEKVEGVRYQTLATGEKLMITTMFLDRGAVIPHHSHPHEQAGYIVSGNVILDSEGKKTILTAGDSYAIPGGASHAVTATEESLIVDVFSPPREDYRD